MCTKNKILTLRTYSDAELLVWPKVHADCRCASPNLLFALFTVRNPVAFKENNEINLIIFYQCVLLPPEHCCWQHFAGSKQLNRHWHALQEQVGGGAAAIGMHFRPHK